jgi:soluble lytic murein transglycosylase-like protein
MDYSKDDLIAYLYDVADRYGIDRNIAYAQISQESRFDPNAVSPAGAKGIAQFMPDTAARFGLSNPFDPYASLEAYGQYMNQLLTMFNWRADLALAGYNSGENRQEYRDAAAQGRPINWSVLPPRVVAQTQPYVEGILAQSGSAEQGVIADQTAQQGSSGSGTNTTPWLLIGLGAAVLLVFALRD